MKSVIFNLGSNHQDFIFTVFSTSARTAPPFYLPPCILYNIVYALQDGNRYYIPAFTVYIRIYRHTYLMLVGELYQTKGPREYKKCLQPHTIQYI